MEGYMTIKQAAEKGLLWKPLYFALEINLPYSSIHFVAHPTTDALSWYIESKNVEQSTSSASKNTK